MKETHIADNLVGSIDRFQHGWNEKECVDARGMAYLEGTSNVQKMIIARELFRLYHKEKNDLGDTGA